MENISNTKQHNWLLRYNSLFLAVFSYTIVIEEKKLFHNEAGGEAGQANIRRVKKVVRIIPCRGSNLFD
jgi:hypothetical protein